MKFFEIAICIYDVIVGMCEAQYHIPVKIYTTTIYASSSHYSDTRATFVLRITHECCQIDMLFSKKMVNRSDHVRDVDVESLRTHL